MGSRGAHANSKKYNTVSELYVYRQTRTSLSNRESEATLTHLQCSLIFLLSKLFLFEGEMAPTACPAAALLQHMALARL